jgi:hypothetical protein
MTVQYKELKHPDTNETTAIERTDADGKVWSIPLDLGNTDYQAYLLSLESE